MYPNLSSYTIFWPDGYAASYAVQFALNIGELDGSEEE